MKNLPKKSNVKLYLIWFVLFFTSFEGLGLRTESWGGLGANSFGWYGTLQLIVLGTSIIFPFLFKPKFCFDSKRKMALPAMLIIIIFCIIIIQTLLLSIFTTDISIIELFSNIVKMKFILLYFIFVYLLTRPNGIEIAFRSLVFCAILAALITLYFVVTETSSMMVKFLVSATVGREYRILLPTGMLLSAGFFYLLTKFFVRKNIKYIIIAFVLFIPVVLQMHRTVLLSLTLVILYSFYKLNNFNFKNLILLLGISGIIISGFYIVFNKIGYSPEQLLETVISSKDELINQSGTFGVRSGLIVNSFKYAINEYYILGVGLNWEVLIDEMAYMQNQFLAGPTNDSGYNNIIIMYGLLGVFVYLLLFFRLFKSISNIIKYSHNYEFVIYAYSLFFILIYILLTAYSADNFLIYNSAFMFTLTISMVYVLEGKTLHQ